MAHKGANQPKRRALGRGLGALMESTALEVDVSDQLQSVAARAELSKERNGSSPKRALEKKQFGKVDQEKADFTEDETPSLERQLLYLSLDKLQPNAAQPRQHFDEQEIAALAQSIRESGVLQPIIVRRSKTHQHFEIVAGERRFRAAKVAGLMKVPALMRQLSDREALELGIAENVQRANLNAIEQAAAYQRLIAEFGATQEEVAKTLGQDRVSVANALRLLKLPEAIKGMIVKGELSAGHGRALLMLDSPDKQTALAREIVKDGLSVRAAEQLASGKFGSYAKRKKQKTPRAGGAKSASIQELEGRFRRVLGTKVALTVEPSGAGELRISFFSKLELESLLERFGA